MQRSCMSGLSEMSVPEYSGTGFFFGNFFLKRRPEVLPSGLSLRNVYDFPNSSASFSRIFLNILRPLSVLPKKTYPPPDRSTSPITDASRNVFSPVFTASTAFLIGLLLGFFVVVVVAGLDLQVLQSLQQSASSQHPGLFLQWFFSSLCLQFGSSHPHAFLDGVAAGLDLHCLQFLQQSASSQHPGLFLQ